jgi:hypothetical protein
LSKRLANDGSGHALHKAIAAAALFGNRSGAFAELIMTALKQQVPGTSPRLVVAGLDEAGIFHTTEGINGHGVSFQKK